MASTQCVTQLDTSHHVVLNLAIPGRSEERMLLFAYPLAWATFHPKQPCRHEEDEQLLLNIESQYARIHHKRAG